ncbi:hypothetical protein GTV32_19245 [Gordonia sp. SID5947]|uniref:hypothetical protein n=1 Tax=Gordonia sp. SID5947 TaxID=2690315 RepID=UPI00136A1BAF|nr:hypothetical protein [Gordonia sp. SID5947]MYR08303.1 hypothetical protein [Gordonia sp. SID5947]
MSDKQPPEWTSSDPGAEVDPDMPGDRDENDSIWSREPQDAVGETDRIAEQKDVYDAAADNNDPNEGDHAVGGSEGTADGQ